MKINSRTHRALYFAPALCLAAAVILSSGCSKKPEREAMPESPDTLAEEIGQVPTLETTPEITPETADIPSETCDTLSVSVKYDTFTDARDGNTYKTVKIGNQIWMAENLNYAITNTRTDSSWCYENNSANCSTYGRLYNWSAANNVCPIAIGWHLPTRAEWQTLVRAVDANAQLTCWGWDDNNVAGRKLKSTSGWSSNGNGIDRVGFSALPGGSHYYHGGSFLDAGNSFVGNDIYSLAGCPAM